MTAGASRDLPGNRVLLPLPQGPLLAKLAPMGTWLPCNLVPTGTRTKKFTPIRATLPWRIPLEYLSLRSALPPGYDAVDPLPGRGDLLRTSLVRSPGCFGAIISMSCPASAASSASLSAASSPTILRNHSLATMKSNSSQTRRLSCGQAAVVWSQTATRSARCRRPAERETAPVSPLPCP